MYHPDKTDNELLKAKFTEIKEAYEVLSNAIKRKKYDLTFDNFSYKREVSLTPQQLLQKVKDVRIKTAKLNPYRLDRDRLEFEITELLSDKNNDTLSLSGDKETVQQVIDELLQAARPLTSPQFNAICRQLSELSDEATRQKIKLHLRSHAIANRWDRFKLIFALAAGILLCLLIYLVR